MTAYGQGFMRKCAEYGISPQALVKWAQTYSGAYTPDTQRRLQQQSDWDTNVAGASSNPQTTSRLMQLPADPSERKKHFADRGIGVGSPDDMVWVTDNKTGKQQPMTASAATDLARRFGRRVSIASSQPPQAPGTQQAGTARILNLNQPSNPDGQTTTNPAQGVSDSRIMAPGSSPTASQTTMRGPAMTGKRMQPNTQMSTPSGRRYAFTTSQTTMGGTDMAGKRMQPNTLVSTPYGRRYAPTTSQITMGGTGKRGKRM